MKHLRRWEFCSSAFFIHAALSLATTISAAAAFEGENSAVPDGLAVITISSSGTTLFETFSPISLTVPTIPASTVSTDLTDANGNTLPAVIGPSGLGWEAVGIPSGVPIVFPTTLPSAAQGNGTSTSQASGDSANLLSTSASVIPPSNISSLTSSSPAPTELSFLSSGTSHSPTSTKSPATTSSGIDFLPFITPRPATVSVVTSSIQGVSTNALVTVKKSSNQNIIVPFLFRCLIFCPAKDVGLLIFGIGPGPGVYVLKHPPIPSLNVITIGHDNKPTPGTAKPEESSKPTKTQQTSQKTTTSTDSCTRSTVAGCFTSCSAGSSTSECSITCSTVSGCSVTAKNSATTSECQLPDITGFPFAFGPDGLLMPSQMNQSLTPSSTTPASTTSAPSTILTSSTLVANVSLSTTTSSTTTQISLTSTTSTQSPSATNNPNLNYCLPNFMSSDPCICTNGTTTAKDSSGNCPDPLPEEDPDQIFIWHYSYTSSDNGNNTDSYEVSQKLNTSEALSDLRQQAIFSMQTQDNIGQLPVQLGPFNIEDTSHGSCNYSGTALQSGQVICDNGLQIQCYLLSGGAANRARDNSWNIELARLLIICSNSV